MYSTKTATVINTESNGTYMPVGINDNITLKEVNVKKSPTNKDFIEFIFENAQGQSVKMTEWKNEKNMWIKTDEELQRRDDQQFGRIMQILTCRYGTEVPDTTINSFAEMINWVKSMLPEQVTNLRLKVIYDKNGYTVVSTNGIFVEPMTVTESQIKLFKRDLMERPVVADKEPATDPFAAGDSSTSVPETNKVESLTSADPNELPF